MQVCVLMKKDEIYTKPKRKNKVYLPKIKQIEKNQKCMYL